MLKNIRFSFKNKIQDDLKKEKEKGDL